jgi:uncharacterized protein YeaC (DUF1315 family)
MDFLALIDSITPEIHERLRRAVEIGRWPDGTRLTHEQKELTLQAVIAYEARHLDETERVGYIDRGSKAEGEMCSDDHADDGTDATGEDPVRWIH